MYSKIEDEDDPTIMGQLPPKEEKQEEVSPSKAPKKEKKEETSTCTLY